ncbi:Gfo/Idh/MocA family oxidoreductase [Hoeflea alexandrii]|uniref:Gfo/Idh/MocA family oxidoreductase n=1 Tax=Hoeflea alexandrii TaxID=288436 RepID=UPI0022AEBF12|nr:Gfo/Idh/MocA family oxidoreductase [Hoeflea alexandrii]MCZ4291929.1 Gfo/Idh/MocA family oxidoreductase [Hoeflea alexandrii]
MPTSPNNEHRVLVAGAGEMGRAHVAALQGLGVGAVAVCAPSARNKDAVEELGADFFAGTLGDAIETFAPSHLVVAAPVERLAAETVNAIEAGVREIMIEKPAVLYGQEGEQMKAAAAKAGARLVVGYNRRYYGSVAKALALIAESGEKVTSINFEFTEWSHIIRTLTNQSEATKARWILANSMHVIDTAFLPVGLPDAVRSQFIASGELDWHPTAQFAGSGVTVEGVPFSYAANWDAPGRWGFEWLTPSRRYIFRPLEKLHVTDKGSVAVNEIPLDDDLDQRFKPGLYRQHEAWLSGAADTRLCDLDSAIDLVGLAERIGGYARTTHG